MYYCVNLIPRLTDQNAKCKTVISPIWGDLFVAPEFNTERKCKIKTKPGPVRGDLCVGAAHASANLL